MIKHLYPKFLTDPADFELSKIFWINVCKEVIPRNDYTLWKPWLKETDYHDGETANIYSLWNEVENKGFYIEQMAPLSLRTKIGARMDVFGVNHLQRPIDFMVVSCELSEPAVEIARELLRKWVNSQIRLPEMNSIIEELI